MADIFAMMDEYLATHPEIKQAIQDANDYIALLNRINTPRTYTEIWRNGKLESRRWNDTHEEVKPTEVNRCTCGRQLTLGQICIH